MKTHVARLWRLAGEPQEEGILPQEALEALLQVHVASEAQAKAQQASMGSKQEWDIFSLLDEEDEVDPGRVVPLRWATTMPGRDFHESITLEDLRRGLIRPRVEKSTEEQKQRVKAKAEVFTPMWVCNMQNNLVDDTVVGPGAFNTIHEDNPRHWTPSEGPVAFPTEDGWMHYVVERRLEMAAGEAPYLMSPYDATTGEVVAVRDTEGRYARIGLLDRKLRVVSEHTSTLEEWEEAAKIALQATYGYEWQGDNLLLARLNMVNTYFDYLVDYVRHHLERSNLLERKGFFKSRVQEVAEISSWQLWQMDGLKQVIPETCPPACPACASKLRRGHQGLLPLIPWGKDYRVFDSFLKDGEA